MEVIFVVPAMLGLVLLLQQETWSSGGDKDWIYGVAIGLITTLMVLSRLDTVIFATLIAFGIVLQPALRAKIRLRLLVGVGLGVSPLVSVLSLQQVHIWDMVAGFRDGKAVEIGSWFYLRHGAACLASPLYSCSTWYRYSSRSVRYLGFGRFCARQNVPFTQRRFYLPSCTSRFCHGSAIGNCGVGIFICFARSGRCLGASPPLSLAQAAHRISLDARCARTCRHR